MIANPARTAKQYRTIRKRLSSIRPSPENALIYDGIDPDDGAHPDNARLDQSIRAAGLHEPLIVTADGYLVSGHRRYGSLKRIGQVTAPCRVLDLRRDSMTRDEFLALLRDHNRQRYKSVAEQVRETMVDLDPEEAIGNLRRLRDKSVNGYKVEEVEAIEIEGATRRHGISKAKADHVKFIKKVLFEDRCKYWPLTVRGVHYALLNYEFMRNLTRGLRYANDDKSYQRTSDLLTRLRLNGAIPWGALDDTTRPLTEFRAFGDVRQFIRQECDSLLGGYWRDLLQTQPNHVEIVCEKNTVYHMVLEVSKKYQIPTMSGRGFASIDPWHDLHERFTVSGKERLVVIILSDFDPEGEKIPHVCGRTLRDDFGLREFEIIKAGVTREQIEKYNLPEQNFAKEDSSNYDWFLARNGGDQSVYELEALDPEAMIQDLENVVISVLDMDLFNLEAQREQEEAVYLEAARRQLANALRGIDK
jgi:hypothetical protein